MWNENGNKPIAIKLRYQDFIRKFNSVKARMREREKQRKEGRVEN